NAALQRLKTGRLPLGVERNDLTVKYYPGAPIPRTYPGAPIPRTYPGAPIPRTSISLQRARPLLQSASDLRKLLRLVVAEARPQSDGCAAADLHDRADAVVLRFVDEQGIFERRFGKRREHRLDGHGPLCRVRRPLPGGLLRRRFLPAFRRPRFEA